MDKLIHVIFVSTVVPDIQEHDILKFLKQARTANRKYDVSGMLLYVGGRFVQLLEGEPGMVDAVSSTIFRDKRNMRPILREAVLEREFPDWTMGFATVDAVEAGELLGDAQFFESVSCDARFDAEQAKTLLSIIGRRRWQADRSGMFRAIRRTG